MLRSPTIFLIVYTCILCLNVPVFAQPAGAVFATVQQSGGGSSGLIQTGSQSVTSPADAANETNDTKAATLNANSTTGTFYSYIHLAFANQVSSSPAAPVTIYVRTNESLFFSTPDAITVEAFAGTTGSTTQLAATDYKVYLFADGKTFLAIRPTANFQSIRITLSSFTLNGPRQLQIFNACYSSSTTVPFNPNTTSTSDCGVPYVTSKEELETLLAKFNVVDSKYAIDNDTTTASLFATNGVTLGSAQLKQIFYFNGSSNTAEAVRLMIAKGGSSLAAVTLGNNLTIQAFNGATAIGSATLINTLLDVTLLGPLGTNKRAKFFFAPKDNSNNSAVFDRLELTLNIGALGIGLASTALSVFDIRRVPDIPIASNLAACNNSGVISLTASSALDGILGSTGLTYKWYNSSSGGLSLFTGKIFSLTAPSSAGVVSYYVDIEKAGCAASSGRKKVDLTVTNAPSTPAVSLGP